MPVQRVRPQCSSNPSDKTSIRKEHVHTCAMLSCWMFSTFIVIIIFSHIFYRYLCYWVFLFKCESIGIASHVTQKTGDQSGTSSKISVFQLLGRITSNSLKSRGLKQNKVFEKSRRVTVHIQCPYL